MTIRNVWIIYKSWWADGKYCGNAFMAACNNKTSAKKYVKQFIAAQYYDKLDEFDEADCFDYSFHDIGNTRQYILIRIHGMREELFDGKKDSEWVQYRKCAENSGCKPGELRFERSIEYDSFFEDEPEDFPPRESPSELTEYVDKGIATPECPKNWLVDKWCNLKKLLVDYYALDINRSR